MLLALALWAVAPGAAAQPELGISFGRATDSKDIDVVRLDYRRALVPQHRWWPSHLQLGAGVWRVPDLSGKTRRVDFSATPVWRADSGLGYLEAGIGAYFLSHTINNDTTRLPSSFQFGSHLGAGLRFGEATLGVAIQHLSNAGIKQPNGGVDFVLFTARFGL